MTAAAASMALGDFLLVAGMVSFGALCGIWGERAHHRQVERERFRSEARAARERLACRVRAARPYDWQKDGDR